MEYIVGVTLSEIFRKTCQFRQILMSGELGLSVGRPNSITGGAGDLPPTQNIQWMPRALSPGSEAAEVLGASHTKRTKALQNLRK
jgi:hypothetical protein